MVNKGDQQYMGLRFCSSNGLPVVSRPVRFFSSYGTWYGTL